MIDYVGVDIGGTYIRVGAIDKDEKIFFSYKENTFKDVVTAEELYSKIRNLIEKVPEYQKTNAIGIGFPGAIDENTMQIVTSKNVGILKNFPLVDRLKEEFNKPIYIENDARVAALAEAVKGNGKNKKIVCYITVSTGLGGGVVTEKNIYHGSSNLGVYLSQVLLDGRNICDDLISGTALIKQAQESLGKDIKNTEELFELDKKNNSVAKEIISRFKFNLTTLLLNISYTINPDIIILGGGVIKSKERFLPEVIEEFNKRAHPLAKKTIIDVAQFDEPGIIGAALFAKNKFNETFSVKK